MTLSQMKKEIAMTEARTPTAGPYTVERQDEDDGNIYYAVHGSDYDFISNFHNKDDADFYAEAGTVAHETGLTPRQLAAKLAAFEKYGAVSELNDEIEKLQDLSKELLEAAKYAEKFLAEDGHKTGKYFPLRQSLIDAIAKAQQEGL